ncbi:MAG: chemotaxis protein CheA [Rhizomicrobium sp.]
MNEFLEQFVLEARELCEQATAELLALEAAPEDKGRIDAAFRAFHTMKGGAGIVDFMAMSRAVHAAEDALAAVRAGDLQISSGLIGDGLSCIDLVLQWLDQIEASGDLPAAPDAAADAMAARFEAARPGASVGVVQAVEVAAPIGAVARAILAEQLLLIADPEWAASEGRLASAIRVTANVFRKSGVGGEPLEEAVLAGPSVQPDALASAIRHALGEAPKAGGGAPSKADAPSRVLRVDAERIDALVSLTGELMVAKNAIGHIAKRAGSGEGDVAALLKQEYARLERLTARLQESVLALRVLPLRNVFQRFSRVIRELAVDLDKPASLVTEGDDTEADKAIVEMLFEPLLHIVRNAMDHGIEAPKDRVASGKPVVATIRLRASRQGDHVVVEVADDGAGVDLDRVREVALQRGVATLESLSAMSDRDLADLIFAPGFSTASAVTDLSGRGVGLDAVRAAVERIGGRVGLSTDRGKGSTVRFTLPFSIMMTRVMTVEAGGQLFGIPLDSVVETARLPRERIRPIGKIAAFVLRDRTIPLIDLAATLGRGGTSPPAHEAFVVIAQMATELGALEIDRLGERMDIMLRPTEGLLAGTPGIAGTTLMGDGRVLLVLDLADLLG